MAASALRKQFDEEGSLRILHQSKVTIIILILLLSLISTNNAVAFNLEIQKQFSNALYLQHQGQLIKAERIFKSILKDDPSLNRVRLEIARNLFYQGKLEESEKYFLLALDEDIPDTVAQNIYFFLRELQSLKPFRFDFSMELLPELINGYQQQSDVVYLDIFGKSLPFEIHKSKPKGSGARGVTNASMKHVINESTTSVITMGVQSEVYENSAFNLSSLNFVQSIEHNSNGKLIFGGPVSNISWEAEHLKLKNYGIQAGGKVSLFNKISFTPKMTFLRQDGYGHKLEHDGVIIENELKVYFARNKNHRLFLISSFENFEHDRDKSLSFEKPKLTLGVEDFRWQSFISNVSISYDVKKFRNKGGFFSEKRIDEVKTMNSSFFNTNWKIFKHYLVGINLDLEISDSSVGLYDFKNFSSGLTLKRLF